MSEVKRYDHPVIYGVKCVLESDFDRVSAERDAALMRINELLEDLQEMSGQADQGGSQASDFEERICALQVENSGLQQRLTAADERADVLEGLVGEVLDAVGREPLDLDAVLRLRAALKPAEGCGDE